MTKSFRNQLIRAEGTIARATGGRKSWDFVALRETALSAMRGSPCPHGDMSPGEYRRMSDAFHKIKQRTSIAHKEEADSI